MIIGLTSFVFLVGVVVLQPWGVVSVDDYSSQCQGIATQCDSPNATRFEVFKQGLRDGGCTKDNTREDGNRFAQCTSKINPQLFKNITDLTDNDQQCKDETDFDFQGTGLVAECEIVGTPLEDCFLRCTLCLRIQKFGFDSVDQLIAANAACPMEKPY